MSVPLCLVTKSFLLLCPCPASSKDCSSSLHPMRHPFTSTVLQGLYPCPKIMAGGIVLHLTQGSGGSKEGMWHTQAFGDGPLPSQLSESIHLWLPFSNFSGHENHTSVYERCTISDCNSRDVLRPPVGTRLPQTTF